LLARKWLWPAVRLIWIVVGLIQGPLLLGSLDAQNIREPSWTFVIEMIAIVIAGVVFVVGLQGGRHAPGTEWPPSWFENPFGRDRWMPLFDATSYYVLAAGISCAALELRETPRTWAWEIPIAIGVGLLLGSRGCLVVF
jgi:hypothetical protein